MKKLFRLGMLTSMGRYLPLLAAMAASTLLAACSTMRSSVVVEPANGGYSQPVSHARTPIPGGSYQVVKGDTLYSIAFRNGVDFRDLAQWNGVSAPYTIWPGQWLKLQVSGTVVAAPSAPPPVVPVHVAGTAPPMPPPVPVEHPHAAPPPPSTIATAPAFEPVVEPAAASSTAKVPNTAAPVQPAASVGPALAATAVAVVPVAGVPPPSPAAVPPPAKVPAAVAGPSRTASGVTWRWPAQGSLIKRFQSGDSIPGVEIAGNTGDSVRAAADGVVVYSGNGLVGYGELVIIKHNDSFLSAYGHNSKRLVKEGQRVSAGQQIAEMGSSGATRSELEFQIRKDGNPVDPLGYLPPR
jgi:lipoprotein NlpD